MGKHITSLSAGYAVAEVLRTALGGRVTGIFPVYAPNDVKAPFVTYARTGSNGTPVKSKTAFDVTTLSLYVYSPDYGESVELMEEVRYAIENKSIHYVDDDDSSIEMRVDCSRVIDSDEGFSSDGYYAQSITIECKIN